MKPDPFDEIARLIETAGRPFPVSQVRRLILRATSRAAVTPELAEAIDRLNASVQALSDVIEVIGDGFNYNRHDALDDLGRLQMVCRRLAH